MEYKPQFHTKEKAAEDAELIYNAGEGTWGTDENGFIKVLLSSPPEHVRNIDAAYRAKYEHDLIHAIEKEFSGSDCAALSFFGKHGRVNDLVPDVIYETLTVVVRLRPCSPREPQRVAVPCRAH